MWMAEHCQEPLGALQPPRQLSTPATWMCRRRRRRRGFLPGMHTGNPKPQLFGPSLHHLMETAALLGRQPSKQGILKGTFPVRARDMSKREQGMALVQGTSPSGCRGDVDEPLSNSTSGLEGGEAPRYL